jgi:hypothetical protein
MTRPSVTERYVTADRPSDVLTAAGWVAQQHEIAIMLWGVMYEGKTSHKHRLTELLADALGVARRKDRRLNGPDAHKIAKEMLAWWCDGVCEACDGRGYEAIQGTPSLSDTLCTHCHGTGKRPYTRDAAHVWMEAELSRLSAYAANEVMKRLAREMEL